MVMGTGIDAWGLGHRGIVLWGLWFWTLGLGHLALGIGF